MPFPPSSHIQDSLIKRMRKMCSVKNKKAEKETETDLHVFFDLFLLVSQFPKSINN